MTARLRTLGQLQDFLDEEYGWRLKEIADMKISVKENKFPRQKTVVRAGITILYAHWEGFVKNAATGYLEFVNNQGYRYNQLENCFVVVGLKKKLDELSESKKTKRNLDAIDFIFSELEKKASLSFNSAINTESNLSSSVFENIALVVGIDPTSYNPKYNLIDESLLKRRNTIAHGEYLDVGPDEYRNLADEILTLIRNFKTDIENAASLKKYMRPT